MKRELNVGETVTVKRFAFMNPSGGTGMSHWEHDERFEGDSQVRITKRWDDYEIGERAWAEAVSPKLVAYLKRNAKPDDQRVFVGEFDLTTKAN